MINARQRAPSLSMRPLQGQDGDFDFLSGKGSLGQIRENPSKKPLGWVFDIPTHARAKALSCTTSACGVSNFVAVDSPTAGIEIRSASSIVFT
jgi:hypothetical protein